MKIKKDDTVIGIAGNYKGMEGKVLQVYPKVDKILVDNFNIRKRHVKKTEQTPQGGVIEVPRPIAVSNVMLKCPKCGKASRIGIKREDGKKVRVCKSCKKDIS